MNLGEVNAAIVETNASDTLSLAPSTTTVNLSQACDPRMEEPIAKVSAWAISPMILKYMAAWWQIDAQASNGQIILRHNVGVQRTPKAVRWNDRRALICIEAQPSPRLTTAERSASKPIGRSAHS